MGMYKCVHTLIYTQLEHFMNYNFPCGIVSFIPLNRWRGRTERELMWMQMKMQKIRADVNKGGVD